MKITIQSTKYSFKNILYLFPLSVIPAFFLSFTLAREEIFSIFEKFTTKALNTLTFTEIFHAVSLFNFSSIPSIVGGLIGFIALVVCVALLMAFTDKHMRIGKRTFNGLFSKLNDNLLSTFGVALLLFVIYELWSVIASAVFLLAVQLPFVAACVALGITFVALHIALLYMIAAIYLWLPCMQITGFKPFEALRYSNIVCEPIKGKLVTAQFIILILCEILISASVLCLPQTGVVSFIVTTVLYSFMIMIFCVRMQMCYLDRTQTERADLKKYYTY